METPQLSLAWTATVDIAEREDFGPSPAGHRYIVPILGGHFEGPRLRGRVRPGGADRQLLRPDGVRELDALYELETDDGAVLTVRNRVLIDDAAPQGRYARSVLQVQAPAGPHDWVTRRVLVGTLQPLRPARDAVRIGVYVLD